MVYPRAYFSARRGSYEVFAQDYDASLARWSASDGTTLLHRAVAHRDPAVRCAVASQLLDDGADAAATIDGVIGVLHVLLSCTAHDFTAEADLVRRLLDGGADVNGDAGPRWGRPLETLSAVGKFSDEDLAPFYDVLFARADLDVLTPGSTGRSVLEGARIAGEHRQALADRALAHSPQV